MRGPWISRDGLTIYVKQQWTRFGELTPPKSQAGVRTIPLTKPLAAILQGHRDRLLEGGQTSPSSSPH